MALLNFEEKEEKVRKIEIATHLKNHKDYLEELKRENEERLKEKEKEMAENEKKVDELRKKGLSKVKFNPYTVLFKARGGVWSRLLMDHLGLYLEEMLKTAAKSLENSVLIEEMVARSEILDSIVINAEKSIEAKKKACEDYIEDYMRKQEELKCS